MLFQSSMALGSEIVLRFAQTREFAALLLLAEDERQDNLRNGTVACRSETAGSRESWNRVAVESEMA